MYYVYFESNIACASTCEQVQRTFRFGFCIPLLVEELDSPRIQYLNIAHGASLLYSSLVLRHVITCRVCIVQLARNRVGWIRAEKAKPTP
ncbi:hypothetical protein COCCADRAFT_86812 [Bipolaris zeicola 26-R-13]|uniref:Uncharacterized protein n=1 Tax=Cochliobolus carbonum (strain 26-R-13) TaxID=930089 RepID=W6YBT6_COCC2|nr:uncharacterized protein COCCADRAFT_86812 [Bipolaris zeicola 26-R-13]EUC36972.1 hypothetical protein COCCADRAFT_86812 [Bipolaris zeicola 26-R-13]